MKIKFLVRYIRKLFLLLSPSDELYFITRRMIMKIWISPNTMSGDELSRELVKLCINQNVLEFGSGGSTLLIGKVAKQLISIESDRKFAKNMSKLIKNEKLNKTYLIYKNIGPVKSFGQPIEFCSFFYRNRYSRYTEIVYSESVAREKSPSVVFVDGRFRVWCVIECLRNLKKDFTLVFDDYPSRSEYHILDKILPDPFQIIGNTAFFLICAGSVKSTEVEKFEEYRHDFR